MQKGTQAAAAPRSPRLDSKTSCELKTACHQPAAANRSPRESTCLLAASLARSWFALGEADVVLGGLKGLQPPLHVLLEDFLVLALLRVLRDEVAAAAGFVLAMTAPPCHEAWCPAAHRNPTPQPQGHHGSYQPAVSRTSHGVKKKKKYNRDPARLYILSSLSQNLPPQIWLSLSPLALSRFSQM